MKANNYQKLAANTAIYTAPFYPFGSIAEESGESVGKINKFVRKNNGTYEEAVACARHPSTPAEHQLRRDLIKELGDLQWQVSQAAKEIDITLGDLMVENLTKLQGRVDRGTLDGAGDTR